MQAQLTTRQRNAKARSDEAIESFRKRYYELAGIDEQALGDALKAAFLTTVGKLTAKKTELVTHQGSYTAVEVEDNQAQLRAAEQVYGLTGVTISKQDGGRGGSVIVQVNFPAHHLPAPAIVVNPEEPTS